MNWDTTRDLPWAKLHDGWFSSASHVDLDIVTLAIGIRCMQLANRRGRQTDGSGLLVNGAGGPLSLAAIAREAHASTEQVERALTDLVAVGTMENRGGVYCFPHLRRWQEDPSAERQRRRRSTAPQGDSVTDSVTVTPDVTRSSRADVRRSEDQKIRSERADPEARAPDEVIPPGDMTSDDEPAPDDPSGPAEPSPLPSPAPEVDRPADAKPGGLPRAVDAEADDRLRRAVARANAAPPPPEDLLDETNGPRLAIEAYNATRHPSLPEASAQDTGLRGAVWATIRNDRAASRAARQRGEPEPEHGMHRLAGWHDLGERTHAALFLHPRRDGPHMRPTPTLLFFAKGRDGDVGAANRSALYAGTWDEVRRDHDTRETAAERQIRVGLERVEATRNAETPAIKPGWMGLLEAGQRAAGGDR